MPATDNASRAVGTARRASVLLADAHPGILRHASELLEPEFRVVGAVEDGAAVLNCYEDIKPDIVILDISMGSLSGLDVARQLREMGHQAIIIFLTVHEGPELICAAMGTGATAYVLKSRLSVDLLDAVHATLAGHVFVSPSLQHA